VEVGELHPAVVIQVTTPVAQEVMEVAVVLVVVPVEVVVDTVAVVARVAIQTGALAVAAVHSQLLVHQT
jgi:hypothetical protein